MFLSEYLIMWDCRVLKRKQSRMTRESQSSGILTLIFYNSMHTTTALSPCSFTSFCVDSLNTSLSLCPFRDGYPLFPFLALSFSPLSSPFQFVLFHSSLSVTKLILSLFYFPSILLLLLFLSYS